jgi:hypothetical protein
LPPGRSTESTAEEPSTADAAEEWEADAAEEWEQEPRTKTNTEGISDNQQATSNGVKERKNERIG